MKSMFFLSCVALVLTGLSAFAQDAETMKSQKLHCTGSYFVYGFSMQASVVGTKVQGPANVVIVDGTGQSHDLKLTVSASDVRAGQYVHMIGLSPQGSGVLSATFSGSAYEGTLDANTTFGNANVNVTCTLGAAMEFGSENGDEFARPLEY